MPLLCRQRTSRRGALRSTQAGAARATTWWRDPAGKALLTGGFTCRAARSGLLAGASSSNSDCGGDPPDSSSDSDFDGELAADVRLRARGLAGSAGVTGSAASAGGGLGAAGATAPAAAAIGISARRRGGAGAGGSSCDDRGAAATREAAQAARASATVMVGTPHLAACHSSCSQGSHILAACLLE